MTDAQLDKYPGSMWHPNFVTYGHPYNSYKFTPKRIDFMMYLASPDVAMCTHAFELPHYETWISDDRYVSLSDHEAQGAEFLIEKHSNGDMELQCKRDDSYDISKSYNCSVDFMLYILCISRGAYGSGGHWHWRICNTNRDH